MNQTTGAPLGMTTPFFYPPDQPGPQEFVDDQAGATLENPLSARALPFETWAPGGPNDWKTEAPHGAYDSAANYMFWGDVCCCWALVLDSHICR
jgi:hypothetical protein